MRKLYVIDTCALISYFDDVFLNAPKYGGSPKLSNRTTMIIGEALNSGWTEIRISVPSVVFVEIYEKWLCSEEFCRMFFSKVFVPLRDSENVEIRPVDRDVLENLLTIGAQLENHDLHDRLVLATAMSLKAPLITTDQIVTAYINEQGVVPSVLR